MNHSNFSTKAQRGFTIIELMIAVTFLAVGLLAAASMQGISIRSNTIANKISNTTTVANMIMEDLLSVEVWRDATGINSYWRNVFAVTVETQFTYDRFPPFDHDSNAIPRNYYDVAGVGRFTANYIVTPLTATESRIKVVLSLNGTEVPGSYFITRHIPQ